MAVLGGVACRGSTPAPFDVSIQGARNLSTVMPGLGPGIHELQRKRLIQRHTVALYSAIAASAPGKLVDARPKAWHDERGADGASLLLLAP